MPSYKAGRLYCQQFDSFTVASPSLQ